MIEKKHRLLLGAHMSIAGSLERAVLQGKEVGCTTIQIFTKNNRQWHAVPLNNQQVSLFKESCATLEMYPVVAHATYLINLAATDPKTEEQSLLSLINELERCDTLGIPLLVLHPGSYGKNSPDKALVQVAQNLSIALEKAKSKTIIALETMAGQGTSLCETFEQIATLISLSPYKDRLGICFDTCHAFAAGYDFSSPDSYHQMWHHFNATIGLKNLKVIHLNDSKKPRGSNVDRHEHIGKGQLGLEPFRLIMNDKRFFDIPKILETPKDEAHPLLDDTMNIEVIKSLLSETTQQLLGIKTRK